ncbi:MAG TPA: putative porin [Blastocatellia bacterium]|nr:putative porin [Blastocatellia bacterium]
MRTKAGTIFCLIMALLLGSTHISARQQSPAKELARNVADSTKHPTRVEEKTANSKGSKGDESTAASPSVEDRLKAMEQLIERQQLELKTLRDMVEKKGDATDGARTADAAQTQSKQPLDGQPQLATAANQAKTPAKDQPSPSDAQKKVDELYKKFGAIRFSGDLRFRAETFRNQGFDAVTESADRNRLRIRARLALDGTIDKHFDWGMRLASGIFTDPITTNQTFTDAFERKPFALERAFIRYDSKTDNVGLQLVAGKFEPTFRRTQMVWDDDINVEGASEALYFKTKTPLRQIKLVAFELPFNEVSGGKDGVLYGGQAQTDWQFSHVVSANVNLAYYDWNHADQIVGLLGAATTQVNGGIQNGAGVTGNQNGALGTTNRLLRNAAGTPIGFLAGFNLVDVLGNVTWQASGRWPVSFTFDYVHNATGRVKDEKDAFWVGGQVGQTREKGDWLLGYYYTRIEQDAVLVPFNFSDILASNSRAHMPTVAYQIANNVQFQWTGLFSQRANKIVLNSPDNRYINRMQFDVIYKF